MKIFAKSLVNRIWEIHTRFIDRFSFWIVLFYALISACALYYAAHNIGVHSKAADMFDSSLPFRQLQDEFNEAFPLTHGTLVIVAEAENPETTDSLTQVLAGQLRNNSALFEDVYMPGGEEFFKKNQLLFLTNNEVEDISEKLSRSYILFSLLAQNYSLRGFFAFLDQVLSMGNERQISKLDPIFGQMNRTIQARMNGKSNTLSWQTVMSSHKQTEKQNQRMILVKPVLDYSNLLPAKPAIESIHKLIAKDETGEKVSIGITGNLAMSYEELQSVINGAVIAGILAFILVGITLWIGLRSFRLIICAILTLLAGLSLTMAFSAVAVGQLNIISIAFAVLYIGLGIDYAIHLVLKFNELILDNLSPFDALRETFKDLSAALVLSAFSTALGFYAFIPTSFAGVSELGIIAGTGMFISLLTTFTLLPALLNIWYGRSLPKTSTVTLSAPFARQISAFQTKHTSLFRISGILAGVASLILLSQIKFDYNPINLRDPDTESVATMNNLINSGTFTPWTVEIMVSDSSSAKRKAQQLRRLKEVGRVVNLFSFVPEQQKEKLALLQPLKARFNNIPPITRDSASFVLQNQIDAIKKLHNSIKQYQKPKSKNLKKLQATLAEFRDTLEDAGLGKRQKLVQQTESALLKTFPATLQNIKHALDADTVSLATLPYYLKNRWKSKQGSYRIEVTPAEGHDQTNRQLRAFASTIQADSPRATGNLITIITSGDTVVHAFIEAMTYAFVVIALLLFIYLRNIKYSLYVLIPIVLASTMTAAAMVLLNLKFNFANIIAIPMLFGLGVDNGIHIVHRARTGTVARENLLETSTARAIFFSALTTLFSFGNLAFSPHPGTASMGIVLTLGLVFTIFATLIILPAFLIRKETGSKT